MNTLHLTRLKPKAACSARAPRSPLAGLVIIAIAVVMVQLSQPRAWAINYLCEPLLQLHFQEATDAAFEATVKVQAKGLEALRTFGSKNWKWSPEEVGRILQSVPTDPDGRNQWLQDFRQKAAKGQYTPEEMLAYMQLVSPIAGTDLYKLIEDRDDIWMRRKKFWTPVEWRHFNRVLAKTSRLGAVNKVILPRKSDNLDVTMVTLVTVLSQIAKPDPSSVEAIASLMSPDQWRALSAKIFDRLIGIAYGGDPWAIEAANQYLYEFRETLFEGKAAQLEFLVPLIQDIKDPTALKEIEKQLTPVEILAYHNSGLPGLLEELTIEKGAKGAASQFRKILADSLAFRTLSLISGAAFVGMVLHYEWLQHTSGAGSGATVNSYNPNGKTVQPYMPAEIRKEIEASLTSKPPTFSPFIPGLLGPDLTHPGSTYCPCDPDGKLNKEWKAYDDYEGDEKARQDPRLHDYLVGWIVYNASKPETGCFNQFVQANYNEQVSEQESQ